MKPVIIYVDDEPHNLTVFEASLPEQWEVHLYDSAVSALKDLRQIKPWVIVSDQRMPLMSGLEFLELAVQLVPEAMRIVVTGQTTEQTTIQLIRRCKIFDYITKPWDSLDMCGRLESAISLYRAELERKMAVAELERKIAELAKSNHEFQSMQRELEFSHQRERELMVELEKWVPPQLVHALREQKQTFPCKRPIVGVAFDIVNSSQIHNEEYFDRPLRAQVLRLFTESVIRHGGVRESHSGDSAFAHFGAFARHSDPFMSALSAAREFRVALRSLSGLTGQPLECGIALHYIPDTILQIHEIKVSSARGETVQKSFDSQSLGIDMLHRMEKLTHNLPGSNIIMSDIFLKGLTGKLPNVVELGSVLFKGQEGPVKVHLIPSDALTMNLLESFRESICEQNESSECADEPPQSNAPFENGDFDNVA
jgi:FixJ family two-component response regulator/class 3 adenylate cyclase